MTKTIVIWLLLAVLVFWAIGAYRRLTRLRQAVRQGFAAVDAQLMRELVWLQGRLPEALRDGAQDAPAPLDDPLDQAWLSLHAAGEQFTASLAAARTQPLDTATLAALDTAHGVLDRAWARVREAAEGADAETAEAIAASDLGRTRIVHQALPLRDAFNEAVARHNAAVRQFPAQVLAWLLGFRALGSLGLKAESVASAQDEAS